MVAIIILNWNGWNDTIDCLESLSLIDYQDYMIFIGDNGSTDNSKESISSYCKQKGYNSHWTQLGQSNIDNLGKIRLIDLQVNNGFAKGNNLLITEALKYNPDYYLFLNNDTEVEPSFLSCLVNYQKTHQSIKVLTPVIYYFYDKEKIWNAGGDLFWGVRKYHFPDMYVSNIKENEFIPCTFITGCALFCTPEVLMDDHKIFTELYFHGEEDFDFGLRMKKKKVPMGCVTAASIYHKVGRSSNNIGNKIGLTYCYYLNRFINLRHHLNFISFYAFILIYSPYVVRLLVSKGQSIGEAVRFYLKVIGECHRFDGVSYEKFIQCAKIKHL